jgi:RNA polymerase sigma-70 factor (ECF subfamily)
MLLHDSRREARFAGSKHGQDLVLLPDQDRSRWDWRQIAEGRALLDRALGQATGIHAASRTGPYVIQAAIASLQAQEQLGRGRGTGCLPAGRAMLRSPSNLTK